jgi:trigger factor
VIVPGAAFRSATADREGNELSSNDTTLENNTENPEAAHEHEGHTADHDHNHEHEHDHQHGPVLNPECTRELIIDVPADEVDATWRRVAANYRKYAKIPGFRAGKVPESIVKRRYATEIRKEVVDTLLPERFNKSVMEMGIKPVGQPKVTEMAVEEGKPFHVKAVFEFLPEFSIEGYKDVTVEKLSVEVTEEEFQSEIDQIRDSRATMEPVEDRPLQDGDWAQVSYKGDMEGAPEGDAGITGEDALIEIGGKGTVEAFTTVLRGARPGQELKAEVVYPADYGESKLAGKTVSYELTVKGIKKRNLPELNDEFAKEFGGYESLEDLRTRVREYLVNRKRRNIEGEAKEKLMASIAEKFTFPVPESLVQAQIDARLERGLRALAAQGMNPDQMRKLDFGRLRGAQRDSALAEVKIQILLDRIAQEENITVSDEEVDHELQLHAMQAGEPVDTLKVRLTQDGSMARLMEQIRREKTANALYERLP